MELFVVTMYCKCVNDFEFDLDLYNVSIDVEIKIFPLIMILQLERFEKLCFLDYYKYCRVDSLLGEIVFYENCELRCRNEYDPNSKNEIQS